VIVKYEIKSYGKDRIVAITCVRETKKTLWIEYEYRGRKQVAQRRKSCEFHDTWQSAHDHLLATAQTNLDTLERRVHHAKATLAEIEALSEPLSPAITTPAATQVS
jgi:hypothetical protein